MSRDGPRDAGPLPTNVEPSMSTEPQESKWTPPYNVPWFPVTLAPDRMTLYLPGLLGGVPVEAHDVAAWISGITERVLEPMLLSNSVPYSLTDPKPLIATTGAQEPATFLTHDEFVELKLHELGSRLVHETSMIDA